MPLNPVEIEIEIEYSEGFGPRVQFCGTRLEEMLQLYDVKCTYRAVEYTNSVSYFMYRPESQMYLIGFYNLYDTQHLTREPENRENPQGEPQRTDPFS